MSELPILTADEVAEIIPDVDVLTRTDDLDRDTWLAGRTRGLGGSDAAALLGLSNWSSPYALWLEKTGRHTPDDSGATLAMRRGHQLEPWILAEAVAQDPDLTIHRAPYQLAHRAHPELLANIDGLATHASRGGWGGIEAKRANGFLRRHWADGPPAYYQAQVQHYLAVTGLDWWMVAADLDLDHIPTWTYERDPDFTAALIERELQWWKTHVVGDVEPPADHHPATTAVLSIVDADPGRVATVDTDELAELFEQIHDAKEGADDLKKVDDAARNRIRQLMGDRTELVGDDGTRWATWRPSKDRTATDWEQVARDFGADRPEWEQVVAKHTTTKPGARTLRIDAGLKQIQEM